MDYEYEREGMDIEQAEIELLEEIGKQKAMMDRQEGVAYIEAHGIIVGLNKALTIIRG